MLNRKPVTHTRKSIMESLALTGLYCIREGKPGYEKADKITKALEHEKSIVLVKRIGRRRIYRKRHSITIMSNPPVTMYEEPAEKFQIDIPKGADPGIVQNNPAELKEEIKKQEEWTRTRVGLALNKEEISYSKAGKILSKLDEEGTECVMY